jgi:hypothetical protein
LSCYQVGIDVVGPPVDPDELAAHGIHARFYPKRRAPAHWSSQLFHLLPAVLTSGGSFLAAEMGGLDISRPVWTIDAHRIESDAAELERLLRDSALPGSYPDNLPAFLRVAHLEGSREASVVAKYRVPREQIAPSIVEIVPWLGEPQRAGIQRDISWEVTGYPVVTRVSFRETHEPGVYRWKGRGTSNVAVSPESFAAIEPAIWDDLRAFMNGTERHITRTHVPAMP